MTFQTNKYEIGTTQWRNEALAMDIMCFNLNKHFN